MTRRAASELPTVFHGFRRTHLAVLIAVFGGFAWIDSSLRYRRRSSATSAALAYRFRGSFSRHLRQIVSRSWGVSGRCQAGETGSSVSTRTVIAVSLSSGRNGGRPVSI